MSELGKTELAGPALAQICHGDVAWIPSTKNVVLHQSELPPGPLGGVSHVIQSFVLTYSNLPSQGQTLEWRAGAFTVSRKL